MDAATYQVEANKTASDDIGPVLTEVNVGLGIVGEACEVIELYERSFYDGPVSREKLIKELGDVQWYIARGCTVLGHQLEDLDAAAVINEPRTAFRASLGIAIKAKDFSELVKKHLTHSHPTDEKWHARARLALLETNAAVLELCQAAELSIEEVRSANIAKLRERYGEKFSVKASIERAEYRK